MDQTQKSCNFYKHHLSEELKKALQKVDSLLSEVEKSSAAPKQGEKSLDQGEISLDQGENSLQHPSILEKNSLDDQSDNISEDEKRKKLKGKGIAQDDDKTQNLSVEDDRRFSEIDVSEVEAQRIYVQRMMELQNIQYLNKSFMHKKV